MPQVPSADEEDEDPDHERGGDDQKAGLAQGLTEETKYPQPVDLAHLPCP